MTKDEMKQKYGATLCALRSYQSVGFFSREYAIMRSEELLNGVLKENEEASEENKENLERKLRCTRLLTYRELFEKMFLCIEDLAAIFSALTHPLSEFSKWIVKEPNIKKAFSNITNEKMCEVLKYKSIDDYEEEEYVLVKKYRDQTIESNKRLLETVLKFYNINEKAYIRMKHGNSLFYSLDTVIVDNQETFVVPVQYNTKDVAHVDILVLNDTTYQKTYKLFQYLQGFERMLCQINSDYITMGEVYHPIGAILEPDCEEDRIKIEEIIMKYWPQNLETYNINTTVSLKCDMKKVQSIMNFFHSI